MDHDQRTRLARLSLKGLSIGDAFGDSFFGELPWIEQHISRREVPHTTRWEFTDDTVMGIAVLQLLEEQGKIEQDRLARLFAGNYQKDVNRGYGGTAHKILREIGEGIPWQQVAGAVFDGQGSMGNGAAMRSGPLGAYFFDQPEKCIEQARLAAQVTHAHPEAVAGAVAVALAAGLAASAKATGQELAAADFLAKIYTRLEDSDTKAKIGKSLHLPVTYRIDTVTAILGNGTRLLAQDTVPFALWCAAHHLSDFAEALWTAIAGLGDRDTIGAIVGSIVILSAPAETIPAMWLASVEDYRSSLFSNYQGR
jgi:ADP-ribosylglycohydrolase